MALGLIVVTILCLREQIEWTVSMTVRLFYLISFKIKGTEEWKNIAHCVRYVQEYQARQAQRNDDRPFIDRVNRRLNEEIDVLIINLELGSGQSDSNMYTMQRA